MYVFFLLLMPSILTFLHSIDVLEARANVNPPAHPLHTIPSLMIWTRPLSIWDEEEGWRNERMIGDPGVGESLGDMQGIYQNE